MKAERLQREFLPHGIRPGEGRLLLRAGDAIALINRAGDEGVPVVAIAGVHVADDAVTSPPTPLADFRTAVAAGHGCWAEAEACVRARTDAGIAFEIALGSDPVEVV